MSERITFEVDGVVFVDCPGDPTLVFIGKLDTGHGWYAGYGEKRTREQAAEFLLSRYAKDIEKERAAGNLNRWGHQ